MTTDAPARLRAWTAGDLAERLGAELNGPADLPLRRVDALDTADEHTLTFIRDGRHAGAWAASRAGAAIVTRGVEPAGHDPSHRALLIVDDADRAMIEVLQMLAPAPSRPAQGTHPTAVVDPSARVAADASIGPMVSIGPGAEVGPGVVLHPGVRLGAGVRLGPGCELRAGVVVEDRCTLGERVVIHANAVIGADGFGYRPSEDGRSLLKIPHAGAVEVHDDVEIGAGTTIDRGKFGSTVIGAGSKIDNLVQIGHNCRIGRGCIICGCCALAGSVTLGDGVVLAGGVGVRDNISIGSGARVGAMSGIGENVPAGEVWFGAPAQPRQLAMRMISASQKLPETLRELRRMLRASPSTQEQE